MQSTLVSVCPAASHINRDHRRFPLFPGKDPAKKGLPSGCDIAIDLHTCNSPVMVCGCTRLKDLFGPLEGSATPVILYVVKRTSEVGGDIPNAKQTGVSKQSTYLTDAAWQPSVKQTPRGMAAFLSSLYLLATSGSRKGVTAETNVLSGLYQITRFPPAVRTCRCLLFSNQ